MAMLTVPSGETIFFPLTAKFLQDHGIDKVYIPTDEAPLACPDPTTVWDQPRLCAGVADTNSVVVTLNWADDTYQIGDPVNQPGGEPQSGIAAYLESLGFFHCTPQYSGKPTDSLSKQREYVIGDMPPIPDEPEPPDETPEKQIKRLRVQHNRRKNWHLNHYEP